jgi:hypothetical protein
VPIVVAILKCPNCGAPLQGAGQDAQRACDYCGALLQVPTAAPPTLAPQPRAQRTHTAWVAAVLVTFGVALVAGLAAFRSATSIMTPPVAPRTVPTAPPGAGVTTSPAQPTGIAWARLESIDIHASADQAKVTIKQQFPEAKVDQDKDYRLEVDHPVLSAVVYSWSWSCACLDSVVFYFKDYPTRMKTQEAFIPCLVRGLGPLTTSAPPFDYEWAAHGDTPRVHMGPQIVSIDIERGTSQASYRNVLRVLGGCRN